MLSLSLVDRKCSYIQLPFPTWGHGIEMRSLHKSRLDLCRCSHEQSMLSNCRSRWLSSCVSWVAHSATLERQMKKQKHFTIVVTNICMDIDIDIDVFMYKHMYTDVYTLSPTRARAATPVFSLETSCSLLLADPLVHPPTVSIMVSLVLIYVAARSG